MFGTKKQIFDFLFDQPNDKCWEIRPYKQKRSMDQNAYYWVLLRQYAQAAGVEKDTAHRDMIEQASVADIYDGRPVVVALRSDVPIERLPGYWQEYKAYDNGFTAYFRLKGSSDMDTAEMSRLLDLLIERCHSDYPQIETMTPNELMRLRNYEPKNKENRYPGKGERGRLQKRQ